MQLPSITGEQMDSAKDRKQIKAYLYQLTEQLRFTLSNLDEENFSPGGLSVTALKDFSAETAKVARLEAQRVKIGIGQIMHLTAAVAEILEATIGMANINWAEIANLRAVILEAVMAQMDMATIDMLKVHDLSADTAIITRGVGDTIQIAKLSVTEGNMVNLTVGELIVRGNDGKFYALTVDADGQVGTVEKAVGEENIHDNSIPGGKIIANSITAAQLNVEEIFANQALIGAITADNIRTETFFTSEAFIGRLETHLIESSALSMIINRFPELADALAMHFDFTQQGLVIRQEGSDFSVHINDSRMAFMDGTQEVAYVSNRTLFIEQAEILSTLQVGKHQWIAEDNGSMSLKFVATV